MSKYIVKKFQLLKLVIVIWLIESIQTMNSLQEIRNDIDYLQSLANYLMLQLAYKGEKAIMDPNYQFDTETLSRARDTIQNYLDKTVEDENAPQKKSTD